DGIRLAARFADLCDLARPFGLRVDLEFMRWREVGTLAQAETVLRRAGKSNGAILLDALHLHRSGGKPADLAPLSASALRAAQLCDAGANIPQTEAEVIAEAREGRLPPGEGVLPLAELLEALPGDVNLSVEMPFPGLEVRSRLARAFDATRRVLAIRSQGTADRARESATFPTRSPSGPRET
ncbi:MAG TPA: TIM barrel protein, partial [Acetobacteraceae bacterium]|nr:TIM barrel protein [Acetobacteraceae bacterium]